MSPDENEMSAFSPTTGGGVAELLKVSSETVLPPMPTRTRMTEPRKCTSAISPERLVSWPGWRPSEIASGRSASDSVSPDFEPFQGTGAPYTVGGVILAGIAFAAVQRIARDPRRVYVRLAIVALVLSWVPDVGLLVVHDPGATVPAVGSLMLMHTAAAAISVAALLWSSPAQTSGRGS